MKKILVLVSCVSSMIALSVFNIVVFANIPTTEDLLIQSYTDNKYYHRVCWLASHNSFAYKDDSFSSMWLHPNQKKSIQEQLLHSVRSFMVDLYYEDNNPSKSIILAHKNDITGGKNYVQKFSSPFLSTIKEWLNDPKHQNDIITVHLESYVQSYRKIIDTLDAIDADSKSGTSESNLTSYLFDLCEYNGGVAKEGKAKCDWLNEKQLETKQLRWPTLGEMRQKNKRLVIFSDQVEDVGYGIMHVSNTMETQYDISAITGYSNCEMRREGRALKAPIFIMNHFYGWEAIPGLGYFYEATNEFNEMAKRAGICALQEGQWPNFIAVDNVGSNGGKEQLIVLAVNEHSEKCCAVAQQKGWLVEIVVKDEDVMGSEGGMQGNLEKKVFHEEL